MAEALFEQIVAAIKTDIEAIVGDNGTNYWYTPDIVVRVDSYEREHLKEVYDIIYLLRETGHERPTNFAAFNEVSSTFENFVMVLQKDSRNADERDPFDATTFSGTIRNRMIRDITKKLEGNHTVGGLAYNLEIGGVDRDVQAPEGWIAAELALEVTYDHDMENP